MAVAEAIPDDQERSEALAAYRRTWPTPILDRALIDRALAVAETIPTTRARPGAGRIAGQLAGQSPARSASAARALADHRRGAGWPPIARRTRAGLIERALALAETIPDEPQRSQALAGIARRLAGADPGDPALIERALAMAETIPGDGSAAGAGRHRRAAGRRRPGGTRR